ncbi:hypothetical protein SAMN03159496_02588 [Rhizobium sp. NFR07]|nr:hypothetical protein SAMN03159496_02588 [Rhizobium sp. NFR07]
MVTHYRLAQSAPLCPAGHLPHKGGDQLGACSSAHFNPFTKRVLFGGAKVRPLVISPLVGEMSGRTEGGNSAHQDNCPAPMAGSHIRKSAR